MTHHAVGLDVEGKIAFLQGNMFLCLGASAKGVVTDANLPEEVLDRARKKGHFSENNIFNGIQNRLARKRITFSETLFRLIDEKGLDEVECYKRANISRKVFSKIRRADYQPSKKTVLAFVGTMGLTMDEAEELMESAGYAFAASDDTDIIVMYFIEHHINDLEQINYALVDFGASVL